MSILPFFFLFPFSVGRSKDESAEMSHFNKNKYFPEFSGSVYRPEPISSINGPTERSQNSH